MFKNFGKYTGLERLAHENERNYQYELKLERKRKQLEDMEYVEQNIKHFERQKAIHLAIMENPESTQADKIRSSMVLKHNKDNLEKFLNIKEQLLQKQK